MSSCLFWEKKNIEIPKTTSKTLLQQKKSLQQRFHLHKQNQQQQSLIYNPNKPHNPTSVSKTTLRANHHHHHNNFNKNPYLNHNFTPPSTQKSYSSTKKQDDFSDTPLNPFKHLLPPSEKPLPPPKLRASQIFPKRKAAPELLYNKKSTPLRSTAPDCTTTFSSDRKNSLINAIKKPIEVQTDPVSNNNVSCFFHTCAVHII